MLYPVVSLLLGVLLAASSIDDTKAIDCYPLDLIEKTCTERRGTIWINFHSRVENGRTATYYVKDYGRCDNPADLIVSNPIKVGVVHSCLIHQASLYIKPSVKELHADARAFSWYVLAFGVLTGIYDYSVYRRGGRYLHSSTCNKYYYVLIAVINCTTICQSSHED